MRAPGYVALVLHAHLPYVRHPEHATPLEERWLHEALWETYLPLLDLLDRLENEGISAPFTLSLSPTVAAMWRDPLLMTRFEAHLAALAELHERERRRAVPGPFAEVIAHYGRLLDAARATFLRADKDLLAAFVRHADAGRLSLFTTSATHAYLPGLAPVPGAVRAQVRAGLAAFRALAGRPAEGFWLPECAYDPRFAADLVAAGVTLSLLDAHGIELAEPSPPLGVYAPVLHPAGLAFFGRDPLASSEVWSRVSGYPGDPLYRDFYRDIGFDRDEEALTGHLGPYGVRIATGLKYHRITGPRGDKAPYLPALAAARAAEHAADFVARRVETLVTLPTWPGATPLVVAPYDAELFGHWWHEGPLFLEGVLRRLAARPEGISAITLPGYLARHGQLPLASPAASTWGEEGYGKVWTGPRTAPLLRPIHHATRRVRDAARTCGSGPCAAFVARAVKELLLLQASDWPFMIHGGDTAAYAEARVREHRLAIDQLLAAADSPAPTPAALAFLAAREASLPLFDVGEPAALFA